ncbi:TonB-dependent receptor plug domain-containing protein [Falsirhodobacter xinxiangensis]|uniref:TonB-dependent receptor plug domain-containing protein n=1 Tax=Falsirhodobacter xinxiangensis TaxID=2530049 RepID=UPI0010AB0A93|nr:TonB-dependent receptor [Rhodobacter xinxiangensis]
MKTSLTAILAALAAPAAAQDILLPPIVVSAGLEPVARDRTGADVTVITGPEIERSGDTRLIDVLGRAAGISIRSTGPMGTTAGLTLRGVPQTGVAVRIDGIDVADPSNTQVAFDFGALTTPGIGRVEILRGAQSALYGSEAVGGVIDIRTHRRAEDGIEQRAAVEYGSFATAKLSYGFAAKSGPSDLAMTLSHIRSDGYSAADDTPATPNPEDDGFEATRLFFAGGHEVGAGRLEVSGFVERSRSELDEFGPTDGTPDERGHATTRGMRLAYSFSIGVVDNTLEYAFFDNDRQLRGTYDYEGVQYPSNQDYVGRRNKIGYLGGVDLSTGRLTFGADRTKESYFVDSGTPDGHDDATNGVYAEYSIPLTPGFDFSLSVRRDHHSRFGAYKTGRISAIWRPTENTIIRANAGSGFRAPSGYELYAPAYDPISPAPGNPDLGPEKSRTYDLGIEHRVGAATLGATLFRADIQDMIDYSFATSTYIQRAGDARRQGIELSATYDVSKAVVTGNYTYSDARSDSQLDSSAWQATTPRHMLNLILAGDLAQGWSGEVALQHAADREGLDDFTVADATLTRDFGNGTEAYLRVENLFDEDYQLVRGYGTAERSAYLGVRRTW